MIYKIDVTSRHVNYIFFKYDDFLIIIKFVFIFESLSRIVKE